MTCEEAANILDPVKRESALLKYDSFERLGKLKEACQIAAEMLRNATEIKPDSNQPLTLEQLREMYDNTDMCGLPSILEVTGVKCFGIVDRRDDDGICGVFAANGSWLKEKEYGKTWIAYAYPPAHIDRETWTAEWKDHYRSGIKVGSGFVCSSCDMWNGEQSDICPYCGRAMSEYGFSKLEKRLRGVR